MGLMLCLFAYIRNKKARWPFASVTYVTFKNTFLHLNTCYHKMISPVAVASSQFPLQITNTYSTQANSYIAFTFSNTWTIWLTKVTFQFGKTCHMSAHTLVINICTGWRKITNSKQIHTHNSPRWWCLRSFSSSYCCFNWLLYFWIGVAASAEFGLR